MENVRVAEDFNSDLIVKCAHVKSWSAKILIFE